MRKKYLSALLFGALLFASAGTFTSCKDYDDDINNLNQRVDQIAADLNDLKTKVDALGCVESIEFSDGQLIVHTASGDVSASMPEYTGIKEVKLEGNTLYVDGVEAGKVELTGEDGETIHVPVITVKDGKLYVDDQLMDIEVGSNVVLVDNGDTCTLTVDGQSVTLMKSGAELTSITIEDLDDVAFGGIDGGLIQWGIASKATPDWAGAKGAIAMNQLLIGQISTVNVQVTPADYDLGAQTLTLVDSRGNIAPVTVAAVANNRLMSRAASSNGSWTLSVTIDETQVNAGNIATEFDYDPEDPNSDAMAYTLCVNGKPFTTYDLSVEPVNTANTTNTPISVGGTNVVFVDADGREKDVRTGKIPVGTTPLLVNINNLYDYYYTFEGTNKSLAEQYGITISEDGKSIIVPEGAEGVNIDVTVHTVSVTGQVYPVAGSLVGTNAVTLQIAGTEIAAETLGTTTHEVKPGDALKEIRVDFTKDGKSIFESFPAANREAARRSAQFKVVEEATQMGFLVNSNNKHEFTNVQYFKADNSIWNATDDILDLSYMTLTVQGNVATDATPGNYNLSFIATENNNGTVLENELIKVTIPVAITVPTFEQLFTQDTNWNDTKDTYTARIIIDGTDATLRYSNAFGKTGDYDVETSHITISFNALDSYNNYPIDVRGNVQEIITNNRRVVATPISSDVTLDKANVYNDNGDALEVSELTEMYAYYDVFDGETSLTTPAYDAVRQAFTVTSKAFTTQIKTALDGITAAVYDDNVVVNNVVLNSDYTITEGSGDGSDAAKFNGFIFRLNGDHLYVNENNLDTGSVYDLLDIFTLYDPNVASPGLINNNVEVTFEGANGETVTWNTTNHYLQFNIGANNTSTLRITLKDATGIEYKQEIKVQEPAN